MSEIDRLIGISRMINIPFDPSTTAGKIALVIMGEKAGEALHALCYVTAMLIKTIPIERRDEAIVYVEHLTRHIILADLDEEDDERPH